MGFDVDEALVYDFNMVRLRLRKPTPLPMAYLARDTQSDGG